MIEGCKARLHEPGGRFVEVHGASLLCRREEFVARAHDHRDRAECLLCFVSREAMSAHRRAHLQFPTCLGVKLGVLLFGNGLHHRVNGVLYPRKISAGILVKGGAL